MKTKRTWLWLFILMATATGCNYPMVSTLPPPTITPPPSTQQAIVPPPAPTIAPTPLPSSIPTALPAPTFTPAPQVFTPFNATVWADHTNIRSNPGYLFNVVANVAKGTSFLILGKSPGGEWLNVETASGTHGWVFAQLFDPGIKIESAPVIQPENVQLVKGRLVNDAGTPIRGVQFSLQQGTGDHPLRNDAVTDAAGEFYAFMPVDAGGVWSVSYAAISCTSNVMDANCTCEDGCGTVDPPQLTVSLPHTTTLEFAWR